MATRRSERLLLANSHSIRQSSPVSRSCSLAALKETPAAVLAIFSCGNDDDDVTHFAFLFFSMSITVKKFLAKGDDDVIAAENATPLAQ